MLDDLRRRRVPVAVAVAALAILTVVRVLYLRSLPGGGTFVKYQWFADEILAGRMHGDRLADLSPGYLWLITLLRSFDAGPWALRSMQVAMVSVVAFCAGVVARRYAGWAGAILAAILVLANRAALINASDFEPETLLLLLEAIAITFVVRETPQTRRSLLAAGAFIGLAIITRPVAILTAIVLGGIVLWRARRQAWLFAAAAAIPILLILGVNSRLTGDAAIMDPGTVFYEGMNPRASGCIGELPQIVKDLQPAFNGPDTLHVVYRVLASTASTASGAPLSREQSNRWWAARAFSFMRHYPAAALALTLRKAHYALQSYDAWDVPPMAILQRSMTAPVWISWAILFALAFAGLLLADRPAALQLGLLALAAFAPMLLFFVTGRHRNPLLFPVAILGAIALTGLWQALNDERRTRALLTAVASVTIGTLLSLETDCARADEYEVRSGIELRAYGHAASEAARQGDTARATLIGARMRTLAPASVRMPPAGALAAAARSELATVDDAQRLFRIAIALDDAGEASDARRLFVAVHEAEPLPVRSLAPPSLFLARSFARSGALEQAGRWLSVAREIAPANVEVLSLSALLEHDAAAAAMIRDLYDPFTATLASNDAAYDLCREATCRASLDEQLRQFSMALPEWQRPLRRITERAQGVQGPMPPR